MINKAKSRAKDTRVYGYAKWMVSHPFFAGSAVMVVGSNIANFIAYIYHLIIGRMLGPANYGELAAFLALLGFVATSFNFMGVVIVKFTAAAEEKDRLTFFKWMNRKSIVAGILISILFLLISPLVSSFLHLSNLLVILVAPMIFLSVINFVYRSFLQGLLRFKEVVISINADLVTRLTVGVVLIYLGYSVLGAAIGILVAAFIATSILAYTLRDNIKSKIVGNFTKTREMAKYSIPVFFAAIASYSLISSDLLLVKHFFPPYEAGLYAALSTLGKIIFYGTGPINSVMFPMISKRHSKGLGYKKILALSVFLTLMMGLTITTVYYLFPELMIDILYGSEYLAVSGNLYLIGIFLTLYAVSSLLMNYYLSIDKTKIVSVMFIAAIVQVIGIWFFHNSIVQVIHVSIIVVSLLLGVLIFYFGYEKKKRT